MWGEDWSWDCSAWRRDVSGRILSICINIICVGKKMREPNSSQWCLSDQDKRQWAQSKHLKGPLKTRNTFLLWELSNTGIDCPKRSWNLHCFRYSKLNCTQCWTVSSSWPCLTRRVGLGDFTCPSNHSDSVWFCDTRNVLGRVLI